MGYLDEWLQYVNGIEDLTKTEQNKMCLSRETIEGLRMSGMYVNELMKTFITYTLFTYPVVKSFVEMARFLLLLLE